MRIKKNKRRSQNIYRDIQVKMGSGNGDGEKWPGCIREVLRILKRVTGGGAKD